MRKKKMSKKQIDQMVTRYHELADLIKALTDEQNGIKDAFKSEMKSVGAEVLESDMWKVSNKVVFTSRFDAKAFKADNSELYDSYVVETAGTRFCIGKA